jgi:Zinc binding domain
LIPFLSGLDPEWRSDIPLPRTTGTSVDLVTVKALLTAPALRRLDGKPYRFCPEPSCDLVYFDRQADSVFVKQDLTVRVGLKETETRFPSATAPVLRSRTSEATSPAGAKSTSRRGSPRRSAPGTVHAK